MDEQERMRILLSAVPEADGKGRWRQAKDGTSLNCLGHHFNGAGLIELSQVIECESMMRVFRLSMYGDPIGIFERDALGEDHLIFDRDSSFGDKAAADADSVEILEALRDTLTPEEENAYYL